MSDPLLEEDDASTPLRAEERDGLIPSYVTLRHELSEAEQANILEAGQWAFARKRNVLDERFLTALHKRMFGRVWRWAGKFRHTERNVGVDPYRIATICGNCWMDVATGSRTAPIRQTKSARAFITGWWQFIPFQMAMAAMRGWPPTCSWSHSVVNTLPGAGPI